MLRHSGRNVVHAKSKLLGRYALPQASSLFDLSGGSLAQSLVFPYQGCDKILSDSLMFCSPSAGFESPGKMEFQARLLELFDNRFADALWGNSGSDGMEIAVWAAELLVQSRAGKKPGSIIVREGGYHGNTRLCRSISSRITPEQKLDKKVIVLKEHMLSNHDAHSAYLPSSDAAGKYSLVDAVKQLLAHNKTELPGILVLEGFPTTGWKFDYDFREYQDLFKFCNEKGIVTVIDDVASGSFRHGNISSVTPGASAAQNENYLTPDILVLSKGLTSGAYPLSCCLMNQDTVQAIKDSRQKPLTFTHGLTEAGAVLATGFLSRYLDIFFSKGLQQRTEFIRQLITGNKDRLHACHIGIEKTDTTIRLDLPNAVAADVESAMLRVGLWAYIGSASFTTVDAGYEARRFLHLCPPFDIAVDEQIILLEQAFNILTVRI
ncbi:MAG: aminotransferase class III-fold pyridoxal phosphate-dependent enzyme [Sedimenticola sp.]